MGADAFIAFYGIRYVIGDADAADSLDDDRVARARRAKLDTWLGRITDGELHCLFVGVRLGVFSVEGDCCADFGAEELAAIAENARDSLAANGFSGSPRFWFQFEAQY